MGIRSDLGLTSRVHVIHVSDGKASDLTLDLPVNVILDIHVYLANVNKICLGLTTENHIIHVSDEWASDLTLDWQIKVMSDMYLASDN